jgi:hypothetical protein
MTLAVRNSRPHVHVYSVFGNFCYLCMHRKRWWRLWENWTHEEHDEPF